MFKKKIVAIIIFSILSSNLLAVDNTTNEKDDTISNDKKIMQDKIEKLMKFYIDSAEEISDDNDNLTEIKKELELELEKMAIAKQEIEMRTNIISNLFIDIEDTKNLYHLEFDNAGNIKEEIQDTAEIIKKRLGGETKIVKIKLKDGTFLPLIKYKVKKEDTLKKILINTYPTEYKPSWKNISDRINTLVSINKSIIKMNYIYPNQEIFIPIFNDNPTKEEIEKQKQMK